MDQRQESDEVRYSICVERILDEGWVRALHVKALATHRHYSSPPRTTLTLQIADQAELLGLLYRLHNMGLTLLAVKLCTADAR